MNRFSLQDPHNRRIAWQMLAVGTVATLAGWFFWNAIGNFDARRAGFGLDFLLRPANIPIGETLIDYAPGDANYRALLVGLLNTVLVAAFGILLATILGTVLGVARLSGNYVASRLAAAYVEFVRNVPLLAHLFVIYLVLQRLPSLRTALSVGNLAFLSNRGLVIPAINLGFSSMTLFAGAAALLVTGMTMRPFTSGPVSRAGVKGCLAVAFVCTMVGLASMTITLPVLEGRAFVGGRTISPELTALVLGLTIYYASFIAEIVRSGILSVPKGQWEAAAALGLRRSWTLRLVVLPQALRLMIPPVTNQYLDLAKMTSLAIAIGYPDLVAVANSIITDTGRAIECVAIIMGAFLLVNLSISTFMNWLNLRVAVVGGAK
ncbi:amino acid ABC transporter permease [Mesorhizobium sp. B4-1-4]|uniref:amino acid ABC transporter permease n=1 Tax=Mesorhizobium sp. B4-1-4 TaxID=2589888 RepID=UPI001AEDAEF7|nr:ABC transporter permease subunit [Mesorhizobium sp. B4-1-4]UCI31904.1 ABC transporter permease subunit [Mesorhizobium sp. B4-1-4]